MNRLASLCAAAMLAGALGACGKVEAAADAAVTAADAARQPDAAKATADAADIDAGSSLLATGDPSACIDGDNNVAVAFVGNDGDIHLLSFASTWTETDLTTMTSAPQPAGAIDCYASDTSANRYVIYRAADNSIHLLSYESSSWSHVAVSSLASAPPAAGRPIGLVLPAGSSVKQVIEYRGQDNYLHELDLGGTSWSHKRWDDTNDANGYAASDPTITLPSTGADYLVAYRRDDGHVMALYWTGTETLTDVSAVVNVSAAGSPVAVNRGHDGDQVIGIRSTNDDLFELYETAGTATWKATNFSTTGAATPAVHGAISGVLYTPGANLRSRWFTPTAASHIFESSDVGTQGFFGVDLTMTTSAPTLNSAPSAIYIPNSTDTRAVFYVASDQHIHEMRTTMSSGGWSDTDLWTAAGIQ